MNEESAKTPLITRSVLGRKDNLKRLRVHVEEWGGDVLIRQLTYTQVVAIQGLAQSAVDLSTQKVRDREKLSRFNFAMIRDSWISEEGDPVLSDEDYATLVNEPNTAIKTLVTAISEFNDMGDDAQKNAKKNSTATRNGDSGIN